MVPSTQTHALTADERLARWEHRTGPIVMAAAILPIAVALTRRGESGPAVFIDVLSWCIFVADLVVHIRLKTRYVRSRLGVFDVAIVVLTAPWYLLPGFSGGRILGLARLGRLGRVFIASKHSQKLQDLARRLGTAAIYGILLMVVCAIVVEAAEPESSGFDTFGDAMWWSIVTFTTVGYGDFYPTSPQGRVAAVLLMLGGIALIGSLAGTLGSFLSTADAVPDEPQVDGPDASDAVTGELLAEVRLLRAEIAELRAAVQPGPGQ
jgi:voltage-gated potassium channel